MTACCRSALIAAVLALAPGAVPSLPTAQSATVAELKAAFLVNFAKFTEWPPDALGSGPLTFCVMEDAGVADALDRMTRGQAIGGRALAVRRTTLEAGVRQCHILFAPDLEGQRATEILDALKGCATLSVSDTRAFTRAGGVAHFFEEGGRMRFAINVRAADRGRLQLSSRLLVLAQIVKEGEQ